MLFVSNFNINLQALGTLVSGAKMQYLSMLVRVEGLHQLDTLSAEVVSTNSEILKSIILGLGTYFYLG